MRGNSYNHLYYFWTVAREGGVVRAAQVLHLTPQTISSQLKVLEDSLGGGGSSLCPHCSSALAGTLRLQSDTRAGFVC